MEKEYFAERFKKMNNEEVILEMRRARSNPGVTRSRINYQVALQEELKSRGVIREE